MGSTAIAVCCALFLLATAQTARAQRKLLQSTILDCTHVHPQCISCVPESLSEATRVVCTACKSPQYQALNGTCGCAAGYHLTGGKHEKCNTCGHGAYCPGGIGADAAKHSCGELLTTDSTTAADATACITLPGVSYMHGVSSAVKCPANTFNIGGNRRNCTECPYGLVTAGVGATDQEVCSAPPGYFYRSRQALPCAVGTYKTGINKDRACESCPVGTTTQSVAATSAADCNTALPGYQPLLDAQTQQMFGAEPCPMGTYSSNGSSCVQCPSGLTTQTPKETDAAACLAPPGYGYYTNTTTTGNTSAEVLGNLSAASSVLACPSGTYKAAWSLESCTSCGLGFLTEPSPATSSDHCYLPPGYGSKRVIANVATGDAEVQLLVATKCMNATYGSEDRQYGLEAMPCQPCPENTATPDLNPEASHTEIEAMLMTSVSNCSNIPGYGWQHGLAVQCPIGYYSPGFDLRPCVECGNGLTTAKAGSSRPQDCIALAGWQLSGLAAAGVCPTGAYSAGGSAPCQTCPLGSTTAGPAATAVTDCSICSPGWGGVQNLTTSQGPVMCAPCTYGTYSPGGTSNPCIACEAGYTSPARAADSSACYPQWSMHNPHTWLPTPVAVLVPASAVAAAANAANTQAANAAKLADAANTSNSTQADDATIAQSAQFAVEPTGAVLESAAVPEVQEAPADSTACQAGCGKDIGCQYYVFKADQQDPSQDGCWYKLQTSTPAPNTYISLKLGTGDYAIWPADAGYDAELGQPVEWTSSNLKPTTPSSCVDACDAKAACLGTWVTYKPDNATWQCKLLSGEFRNDVTSAIQAVPQHINDNKWAKDCIGAWGPFGSCNQTCGGGSRTASYTILQAASSDGAQCETADGSTKSEDCNTQDCPQDCVGSWVWGECSKPCGGGMKTATFTVTTAAAAGGRECEATDGAVTNQTCNTRACPQALQTTDVGSSSSADSSANTAATNAGQQSPATPAHGNAQPDDFDFGSLGHENHTFPDFTPDGDALEPESVPDSSPAPRHTSPQLGTYGTFASGLYGEPVPVSAHQPEPTTVVTTSPAPSTSSAGAAAPVAAKSSPASSANTQAHPRNVVYNPIQHINITRDSEAVQPEQVPAVDSHSPQQAASPQPGGYGTFAIGLYGEPVPVNAVEPTEVIASSLAQSSPIADSATPSSSSPVPPTHAHNQPATRYNTIQRINITADSEDVQREPAAVGSSAAPEQQPTYVLDLDGVPVPLYSAEPSTVVAASPAPTALNTHAAAPNAVAPSPALSTAASPQPHYNTIQRIDIRANSEPGLAPVLGEPVPNVQETDQPGTYGTRIVGVYGDSGMPAQPDNLQGPVSGIDAADDDSALPLETATPGTYASPEPQPADVTTQQPQPYYDPINRIDIREQQQPAAAAPNAGIPSPAPLPVDLYTVELPYSGLEHLVSNTQTSSNAPPAPRPATQPHYNTVQRIDITAQPGASLAAPNTVMPVVSPLPAIGNAPEIIYNSPEPSAVSSTPAGDAAPTPNPAAPHYNTVQRIDITAQPGAAAPNAAAPSPAPLLVADATVELPYSSLQSPPVSTQPSSGPDVIVSATPQSVPHYDTVKRIDIRAGSEQPEAVAPVPSYSSPAAAETGLDIGLGSYGGYSAVGSYGDDVLVVPEPEQPLEATPGVYTESSQTSRPPQRSVQYPDGAPVNCEGALMSWTKCSAECGGGMQSAVFVVKVSAANGGKACMAEHGDIVSRQCNTQACPAAPVDCVGEWSWTACTAECGGGRQTASYAVTTPAANGGKACIAKTGDTVTLTCNTRPCGQPDISS